MEMQWWHYLIILLVLVIVSLVIMKLKQKNFSSEVNKLIQYLGGKDNIINAEVNMSRLKVILKDVTKANKEGIRSLGKDVGVVEIDNALKIVYGKDAKQLKKCIDDMM